MHIRFSSKKMEKIFASAALLDKAYGNDRAKKIRQYMGYLQSQPNFGVFDRGNLKALTGFHLLVGNKAGRYAMKLNGNYSLILELDGSFASLDCADSITITDVEDYH